MRYRVDIGSDVVLAINEQLAYFSTIDVSVETASRWVKGLYDRAYSLDRMPRRYPVAELASEGQGIEIRRLNYGEHALFYFIDESVRIVHVVSLRHGKQRPWDGRDETV